VPEAERLGSVEVTPASLSRYLTILKSGQSFDFQD